MNMFNPPHPGRILKEDVLPAMKLSVTDAAKKMNITRVMLSRIINEKAAITPEMSLKIEAWLGLENGGRAELWAGMQLDYDMWQARQHQAA